MTAPAPGPEDDEDRTGGRPSSIRGAIITPQDVEQGLYEGNPLAALIEGFCLAPAAGADLESRPVIHVQLRPESTLSAVEADRLARLCQQGVRRRLAATGRDAGAPSEERPAVQELAIVLHPYGTGPFAAPREDG
ncbi:coenzyme f390 synthetase [Streptomyces lydicus]|uniref:coenzyme f390 synthetase n=1 Tax=Streptomyces lydicus TaxID=47763 RepID=UPI0036E21172